MEYQLHTYHLKQVSKPFCVLVSASVKWGSNSTYFLRWLCRLHKLIPVDRWELSKHHIYVVLLFRVLHLPLIKKKKKNDSFIQLIRITFWEKDGWIFRGHSPLTFLTLYGNHIVLKWIVCSGLKWRYKEGKM